MEDNQFQQVGFGKNVHYNRKNLGLTPQNNFSVIPGGNLAPAPMTNYPVPGATVMSVPINIYNPAAHADTEQDHAQNGIVLKFRATNTKSQYPLKNLSILKWLVLIQTWISVVIFLSQIMVYAMEYGYDTYIEPLLLSGIGIWAPMCIFSVAIGLSCLAAKSPSACIIGAAMGFQVASIVVAGLLLILSLMGIRGYYAHGSVNVFLFLMVLCAGAIIITGTFVSLNFCHDCCCGKRQASNDVVYDVEMEMVK